VIPPPTESLSIPLPGSFPIEPEAELIVVTERGVKTKQYEGAIIYGPSTVIIDIDPNKFYTGPMLLLFDEFWYRHTFNNGTLDPDDYWHNGWLIEKGFGSCTWNLTVTNVDDRNITLNHYSSFTLVPNDSPSNDLTWYMEPISQPLTQTLVVNQTDTLLFKWTVPKDPEEMGSVTSLTIPEATCMGFITLYGLFHEHDGSTTPYAQTIPFEAVIIIRR
jgi:hypothetical protein